MYLVFHIFLNSMFFTLNQISGFATVFVLPVSQNQHELELHKWITCWWDLGWILTCLVIHISLKHWLLSHTTLECLPSLSVTLHRWQPWLQLSNLLLVFGLTAAVNTLKIHKNLKFWDKILKKITQNCDDIQYVVDLFGEVWL